MKPYYEDGSVTIYHGDGTELAVVGNVLLTDPPYGFGHYDTDHAIAGSVLGSLIETHVTAAIFGYPELLAEWCVATGKVPTEWVTWWGTNLGSGRTKLLSRTSEHIAIFGRVPGAERIVKPRSENAIRIKQANYRPNCAEDETSRGGDVWVAAAPGMMFEYASRLHPNEKPLTIMHQLVLLCSEREEVILDPFTGSGTTLVAAKQLGRKAIGIEIEERYCEIAANRCRQEVLDFEESVG